jgi:hypothetical protein
VFVNGMVDEIKHGERTGRKVIHTAHWSAHFAGHPWVEASEAEGWGRDLRMSVIQTVKRRIMGRHPFHDIDQLMPPKDLVEFWREKAAREREAAAWQEQHFVKHDGKPNEPRPLGAATREVFQKMQRDSRNKFHLDPLAELSAISKRMSGERA